MTEARGLERWICRLGHPSFPPTIPVSLQLHIDIEVSLVLLILLYAFASVRSRDRLPRESLAH